VSIPEWSSWCSGSHAVIAGLPLIGVRTQYFDFTNMLAGACPQFDGIDWREVRTRLLLGASEVINGVETVFDSDCSREDNGQGAKHAEASVAHRWRRRLPLTLRGAAASGTLAEEYKPVTARTIKMRQETAAELRTSSKFDRSRGFIDRLRKEGQEVARDWLARWSDVGCYPEDAAY
jgi:hypothetical protein